MNASLDKRCVKPIKKSWINIRSRLWHQSIRSYISLKRHLPLNNTCCALLDFNALSNNYFKRFWYFFLHACSWTWFLCLGHTKRLLAQDVSRKLGLSEQNLESTCASIHSFLQQSPMLYKLFQRSIFSPKLMDQNLDFFSILIMVTYFLRII